MSFLTKVTNASKRSGYRFMSVALSVLLATGVFLYRQQHAAAVPQRFMNRSLYINSSIAGENTFYTISFMYPSVNPVGSVQMLFCTEAIPALPCDAPVGLDLSGAVLSAQSGEVSFTITSQTANKIVISRPAVNSTVRQSAYTFTNIKNPTGPPQTFYARLNTFTSTDASGPFIDYGSVASATENEIGLITQVPPYLVFCTGKTIPDDCMDPRGPNYEEFSEEAVPSDSLYTSSEMLAYTNARNGYAIVVAGRSLTSGIYEIPAIVDGPEESLPGKAQFGINLTKNDNPVVGSNPVGPGINAVLNTTYTQTDKFIFRDGDVLVRSNGVTRQRKFTVSYIINIPPDQHPGVYSTTVTFICTGAF